MPKIPSQRLKAAVSARSRLRRIRFSRKAFFLSCRSAAAGGGSDYITLKAVSMELIKFPAPCSRMLGRMEPL